MYKYTRRDNLVLKFYNKVNNKTYNVIGNKDLLRDR